jgi:hypothetical protein
MSEYSPPNWTEPLPIYNPINFRQTAQTTNGGGGGGSGFLKYPVAQGPQTMKDTLINGSFSVSASEPVNMGGNIVQNAGTPVNPTDLATKAYVDLNAGTQNLQSVLTAGNTTGNFQINHSANYGDIYNGSGANWVVACDPVQFSSSATNDLYLASNATDNFVRMGSYSGSTFTETARIGDLATGEKRAIISGTLKAECIEDNAPTPSKGTSGQFLSCGTGGNLLWANVSGGGGVSSITAGNNISVNSSTPSAPIVSVASPLNATLDVGSQSITSTTSPIGLTPLAGQDCNVVVSGAGGLHIQQTSAGGQANPSCRMTNSNATGSVALEVYKNKPTAVVAGDVLHNLSVYGKDSGGNKQEYTRISHTIRDGTGASEDGSIEFLCFTGGAVSTFLQINGLENEINSFKTLDMGGNAIRTTTGDMTISTQPSTGTGNMNITAKSTLNLTANTGNMALSVNNSGASIQLSGTSFQSTFLTQAIYNCPAEFHTGKITTLSTDQVYQTKYQPLITTTPLTFPIADFQRDGQDVMLINSKGDGNNEMTILATPNFTLCDFVWVSSLNHYVGFGYNHIQNRNEIRCAMSLNAIIQDLSTGSITYIIIPPATNPNGYIFTMCYDPVLFPNIIAFGGDFSATPADLYNATTNYPSNVSNFLCVDISTTSIAPADMNDPASFPYTNLFGTNGVVRTIATISGSSFGAGGSWFLIGGTFSQLISSGGTPLPCGNCALFALTGGFTPLNLRWIVLVESNDTISIITTYNNIAVFGGYFTAINVGGATGGNSYLAWSDNIGTGSCKALGDTSGSPFTPPSPVVAGSIAILNSGGVNEAYVGCQAVGSPTTYPVYNFTYDTISSAVPTLYKDDFPAGITGFGVDLLSSTKKLNFITGFTFNPSGAPLDSFVWDVQTPQLLDMNGAISLKGIAYDTTISPNIPYFMMYPPYAKDPPLQLAFFDEIGDGAVVINTTSAFPFVNAFIPTSKFNKITLANRNNFAIGTIVGFGTDDVRVFFYAQNGATFSN